MSDAQKKKGHVQVYHDYRAARKLDAKDLRKSRLQTIISSEIFCQPEDDDAHASGGDTMNSRERMALAMQLQQPDRVPVMCQLALGHYFLNTDYAPHEIWFDSEAFAEALVALQRRYRFDGILVNIPGRPPDLLDQVARIERTPDGEQLTWRNGEITFCPWDDNPYHMTADGEPAPRADFATFDPDRMEALDGLTGYTWGVYHVPFISGRTDSGPMCEFPPYFLRSLELVKQKAGPEVSVHGEVFSPFTHFVELFGYETALLGLLADPGKTHAILDRMTESCVAWALAQARHGADAVLISSAFAGGPFLSRGMYADLVIPYERRVADAVRASGVPVYTHTCGRIGDRLDLMVQTGTGGIDTMDPPPLGNTELADAKAQVGGQVFLKGNMDSVVLLRAKTAGEVIVHATGRIETGMPGGGYILSTACSVAPRVEPWKLELLTPLAEEIGRY
jgi:uroporphyrinogen-III decarboxylase